MDTSNESFNQLRPNDLTGQQLIVILIYIYFVLICLISDFNSLRVFYSLQFLLLFLMPLSMLALGHFDFSFPHFRFLIYSFLSFQFVV